MRVSVLSGIYNHTPLFYAIGLSRSCALFERLVSRAQEEYRQNRGPNVDPLNTLNVSGPHLPSILQYCFEWALRPGLPNGQVNDLLVQASILLRAASIDGTGLNLFNVGTPAGVGFDGFHGHKSTITGFFHLTKEGRPLAGTRLISTRFLRAQQRPMMPLCVVNWWEHAFHLWYKMHEEQPPSPLDSQVRSDTVEQVSRFSKELMRLSESITTYVQGVTTLFVNEINW